MPFKSEKQRRWMWANDPEMAEKWEKEEDEKNEGKTMKITRNQLRKIIREETVGVEDVNYTADSFGGGEVGEEMFIDVDGEDLLNVNEKRPGAAGKVADIKIIPERKRITKRQLIRIIREEKRRLLNEMWGESVETGLPLIEFARAYSGMGGAVQDQVDSVVAAYVNGGGPDSETFRETVYEQNPNAIDMAMDRLGHLYMDDNDDYHQLMEALEYAQRIFEQGDEEVEADARAAGDR